MKRINRRFAIASKPVTVAQFAEFKRDNPHVADPGIGKYAPTDDCPQNRVTWSETAEYCNWLSWRAGIPRNQWCYRTERTGHTVEASVAKNHLLLSGYRLPTEAEWEYACRAGSCAGRYYGDSDELLGLYAWFNKNAHRTMPIGLLKPNDYGLFDMLGNVEEWCQDRFRDYPFPADGKEVDDVEDRQDTEGGGGERVQRGGSWIVAATLVRSADRDKNRPDDRRNYVGFRPARTCTGFPDNL